MYIYIYQQSPLVFFSSKENLETPRSQCPSPSFPIVVVVIGYETHWILYSTIYISLSHKNSPSISYLYPIKITIKKLSSSHPFKITRKIYRHNNG